MARFPQAEALAPVNRPWEMARLRQDRAQVPARRRTQLQLRATVMRARKRTTLRDWWRAGPTLVCNRTRSSIPVAPQSLFTSCRIGSELSRLSREPSIKRHVELECAGRISMNGFTPMFVIVTTVSEGFRCEVTTQSRMWRARAVGGLSSIADLRSTQLQKNCDRC